MSVAYREVFFSRMRLQWPFRELFIYRAEMTRGLLVKSQLAFSIPMRRDDYSDLVRRLKVLLRCS